MPVREEVKQELIERQAKLTAISRHPNWGELREEMNRKKRIQEESLLKRMLSPEPPTQREVDRYYGFWLGAKYVLDTPDFAERSLNKALMGLKIMEEDV